MSSAIPRGLLCPFDGNLLSGDGILKCAEGHQFPIFEGIPILLTGELAKKAAIDLAVLERVRRGDRSSAVAEYLKATGFGDPSAVFSGDRHEVEANLLKNVVPAMLRATSGNSYRRHEGPIASFPFPRFPSMGGAGQRLLDLGCGWGKWTIAAARQGFISFGVDQWLSRVFAARQLAWLVGVRVHLVVADIRNPVFEAGSFDRVFSYSVLQHLSETDLDTTLTWIGQVLQPGGESLLQLANALGIRSVMVQAGRRFGEAEGIEVRYRQPARMLSAATRRIGPSALSPDCYFGLGLGLADLTLVPWRVRTLIRASETVKTLSSFLPGLSMFADSVFIRSTKP